MHRYALPLAALLIGTPAVAASLTDLLPAAQQVLQSAGSTSSTGSGNSAAFASLSQSDASTGLKDALAQGARVAVQQLGQQGGFANDPQLRIGLPGKLGQAASAMKMFGMGSQVTALEDSMNRAAEAAVPQALDLLIAAVQNMTMADAKSILAGGDNAATQFLDRSSREQLRTRFLPVVQQATGQVGLVQQYNSFAGAAAAFGQVDSSAASLEGYVTEKALDGLFSVIAQKEAEIRQNPTKAATDIARRVFGMQ